MAEKTYYVYLHTFSDGKRYIGITSMKPEARWKEGRGYRRKKKGRWCQPYMAKATLKHDWNDIKHEILYEGLTKEEAKKIESELIKAYRSDEIDFGYNIKP